MRKIFFLCFLILLNLVYANESLKNTLSINITCPALAMNIFNNDENISKDYTPNNPWGLSLGYRYNGIGFNIACGKAFSEIQNNITTTFTDFQGFVYLKTIGFDLFYQTYKGYYHEDELTKKVDLYPNLMIQTFGINNYFMIKGNVDLNSFNTGVVSDRSISYVTYCIGSFSYREINSDKSLLEVNETYLYQEVSSIKHISFYIPSFSLGILVPMHYSYFYFNPAASLGVGYPFTDYTKSQYSVKGNIKTNSGIDFGWIRYTMKISGDFDAVGISKQQGFQFNTIYIDFGISVKF